MDIVKGSFNLMRRLARRVLTNVSILVIKSIGEGIRFSVELIAKFDRLILQQALLNSRQTLHDRPEAFRVCSSIERINK